jgi:hypothetical protein
VSNGKPQRSVTVSNAAGVRISTTAQQPGGNAAKPVWMNLNIAKQPAGIAGNVSVSKTATAAASATTNETMVPIASALGLSADATAPAAAAVKDTVLSVDWESGGSINSKQLSAIDIDADVATIVADTLPPAFDNTVTATKPDSSTLKGPVATSEKITSNKTILAANGNEEVIEGEMAAVGNATAKAEASKAAAVAKVLAAEKVVNAATAAAATAQQASASASAAKAAAEVKAAAETKAAAEVAAAAAAAKLAEEKVAADTKAAAEGAAITKLAEEKAAADIKAMEEAAAAAAVEMAAATKLAVEEARRTRIAEETLVAAKAAEEERVLVQKAAAAAAVAEEMRFAAAKAAAEMVEEEARAADAALAEYEAAAALEEANQSENAALNAMSTTGDFEVLDTKDLLEGSSASTLSFETMEAPASSPTPLTQEFVRLGKAAEDRATAASVAQAEAETVATARAKAAAEQDAHLKAQRQLLEQAEENRKAQLFLQEAAAKLKAEQEEFRLQKLQKEEAAIAADAERLQKIEAQRAAAEADRIAAAELKAQTEAAEAAEAAKRVKAKKAAKKAAEKAAAEHATAEAAAAHADRRAAEITAAEAATASRKADAAAAAARKKAVEQEIAAASLTPDDGADVKLRAKSDARKKEFARMKESAATEARTKLLKEQADIGTAEDHAKQEVIRAAKIEIRNAPLPLPIDIRSRKQTSLPVGDASDKLRGLSVLHAAARKGHHKTLSALIRLQALDPAFDSVLNQFDGYGMAPIHYAAYSGSIPTVDALFRAGANVNPRNGDGLSPTDVAWAKGNGPMVQMLREKGAVIPVGKKLGWDSLKMFWVPDKAVQMCMCCQTQKFSAFKRRHHCRQCGDVICSSCTVKSCPPWLNPREAKAIQSVCTSCDNVWKKDYVHSR